MIRKTSKRRGTSVIAALVVLCAVLGYGLMEWKPLTDTPQAVPASGAPGREGFRRKSLYRKRENLSGYSQ